MENNKPFSCLAMLNQFPGIRFRVHICPKPKTNKNGTTSSKENMTNLSGIVYQNNMTQNQDAINDICIGIPENHCREANFYIIITNHKC